MTHERATATRDHAVTRQISHIRRTFWIMLTGALLLALAFPLSAFWRSTASTLHASTCVWPRDPRAGTEAQVFVVAQGSPDSVDLQNTSTTVDVTLTGPGEGAAPIHMELSGPPRQMEGVSVFAIPIYVASPGAWTADVHVQAPGRPTWREKISFQVGAPTWTALPFGTQEAPPHSICPGATTSRASALMGSVI